MLKAEVGLARGNIYLQPALQKTVRGAGRPNVAPALPRNRRIWTAAAGAARRRFGKTCRRIRARPFAVAAALRRAVHLVACTIKRPGPRTARSSDWGKRKTGNIMRSRRRERAILTAGRLEAGIVYGPVAQGLLLGVKPTCQTTFLMFCNFQLAAWPSAKPMVMEPGMAWF